MDPRSRWTSKDSNGRNHPHLDWNTLIGVPNVKCCWTDVYFWCHIRLRNLIGVSREYESGRLVNARKHPSLNGSVKLSTLTRNHTMTASIHDAQSMVLKATRAFYGYRIGRRRNRWNCVRNCESGRRSCGSHNILIRVSTSYQRQSEGVRAEKGLTGHRPLDQSLGNAMDVPVPGMSDTCCGPGKSDTPSSFRSTSASSAKRSKRKRADAAKIGRHTKLDSKTQIARCMAASSRSPWRHTHKQQLKHTGISETALQVIPIHQDRTHLLDRCLPSFHPALCKFRITVTLPLLPISPPGHTHTHAHANPAHLLVD